MEEREFFNETTEMRTHTLTCPKCGQSGDYKVTWVVRRKRGQLPRNADKSASGPLCKSAILHGSPRRQALLLEHPLSQTV